MFDYDILRTVFKYLNGRDLANVSMVCRSWLNTANDEKQIRMGPIYNRANIVSWYSPYNKEQVKEILRAKPRLGLIFKLSMPFVNPMDSDRLRASDRSPIDREPNCCCTILPNGCDLIILDTYGVVINNNEAKDPLNYEDNLVYLYLPEIPNVSIKVVATNSVEDLYDIARSTNEEKFGVPIKELSTLLLFCKDDDNRFVVNGALRYLNTRDKFSVWGGVVKNIHICNWPDIRSYRRQLGNNDNEIYKICNQEALYVGICISGSIESWSVVIDEKHNTKESVEQALNSFKEQVCLKNHSIGLMFACRERDTKMFNDCKVESTIFKNLFPKVPLVGCFGVREYGNTVGILPTGSIEHAKEWYKKSTVFLIITYG